MWLKKNTLAPFPWTFLRVKLMTVVHMRGREKIILMMIALALNYKASGGPSKPLNNSRQVDELYETAPIISRIETLVNENTIEVFINGWSPSGCFNKQDISVDTENPNHTKVVLRLQDTDKSESGECSETKKEFRIKVADLAKSQKNSYLIKALGHRGWHTEDLRHKAQQRPSVQEITQ